MPGPPFVCGGFLVILAIVVALHMPVKDLLTEELNKHKQDTGLEILIFISLHFPLVSLGDINHFWDIIYLVYACIRWNLVIL